MKRIAVVEDNPDNRLLVRAILEAHYEITEYAGGAEALHGMRVTRPDLVLLDISLPEMDGTDVLALMKSDARLKGLPVIALTAHAMAGDRERFLEAGFDEYISKPIVDEALLVAAVDRFLAE